MNSKYYSAFAVAVVAMGAVAFTATEASATHKHPAPGDPFQHVPSTAPAWPDEGSGYPQAENPSTTSVWPDEGSGYPVAESTTGEYNYPTYDKKFEVPPAKPAVTAPSSSDGSGFQFVQSGASAVAGAAVAMGGMWVYRRRQMPTA